MGVADRQRPFPRKVFFLVTVDGDLRVGSPVQQRRGVEALRACHARLGLLGRTTWFINENDFGWTEQYGDLLLDLADSGEAIGLHDHLDTHDAETYADALALMSRSLEQVAEFLARAGREGPLRAHRNGCFQQGEAIYRAARDLGYIWLSDVWPQMALYARMVRDGALPNPWRRLGREEGGILIDNARVPLNGTPWRHDPGNWLDTASREGHFLHVPVTCAPFIDWERVQAALHAAGERAFLVLDTHPYDLQDPETGEIDPARVGTYETALRRVRDGLSATFIRIDEVGAFWPA